VEFGFYAMVAVLVWQEFRKKAAAPAKLAGLVVGGMALVVCSFVRSGVIGNNDLGWRGMLVAQFFLLFFCDRLCGELE